MLEDITILYVEDEAEIQRIVKSLFVSLFKDILVASDGKEGLELYKQHKDKIDIVISDINMPKMDGLEMSAQIRELCSSIPIIITTAHQEHNFLHKSIEIGISKYVSKPIDMKILLSSIKSVLEPVFLQRKLDEEKEKYMQERVESAKFTATGQLAAGLTHEINTPLTYIKANAEMMTYELEDLVCNHQVRESLVQSVEKIIDGISRIENIINSMKEISVQKAIKSEDVNIYQTIVTSIILAWNKVKHLTDIYINGEKFDINNIDKNRYVFMGHVQSQRVEQVWIIIINNALDELMKKDDFKSRRLDIMIKDEDEHIKVVFKDNAGGIDQNILPVLFDPFKGSKDSSGMGVGLSIAKKIIDEQIDASIEAYNEDDGAVFEIKLKKSEV